MYTNEDVESLIEKLRKRQVEIMNKYGRRHLIVILIQDFLGGSISDWSLFSETGDFDSDYNEKIINQILDMVNKIRFYKE